MERIRDGFKNVLVLVDPIKDLGELVSGYFVTVLDWCNDGGFTVAALIPIDHVNNPTDPVKVKRPALRHGQVTIDLTIKGLITSFITRINISFGPERLVNIDSIGIKIFHLFLDGVIFIIVRKSGNTWKN